MTILTLGDHFEGLIKDLVQDGHYEDASAVVREALRLLEERERKLARLDSAIERGLADADAGRVHSADEVRSRLQKLAEAAPQKA